MSKRASARPGRARLRPIEGEAAPSRDWRQGARCGELPTDLFFSELDDERDYAKSICRRCSVVADCLAEALVLGEPFGVWGGLSATERRLLQTRIVGQRLAEVAPTVDGPAAA